MNVYTFNVYLHETSRLISYWSHTQEVAQGLQVSLAEGLDFRRRVPTAALAPRLFLCSPRHRRDGIERHSRVFLQELTVAHGEAPVVDQPEWKL